MIWFLKKSTLYQDLPYKRLLYKQSVVYSEAKWEKAARGKFKSVDQTCFYSNQEGAGGYKRCVNVKCDQANAARERQDWINAVFFLLYRRESFVYNINKHIQIYATPLCKRAYFFISHSVMWFSEGFLYVQFPLYQNMFYIFLLYHIPDISDKSIH